jgi:hypothetical protein
MLLRGHDRAAESRRVEAYFEGVESAVAITLASVC